MQPSESIGGSEVLYDLTLLDLNLDYQLKRPWLLAALGVTEDDLRRWEASITSPPTIETVALPDDEDFEVTPRGGETEFILDDPDEDDEDDEDAESRDEDDENSDDESDEEDDDDDDDDESEDDDEDDDDDNELDDVDASDFDDDNVVIAEDDGES